MHNARPDTAFVWRKLPNKNSPLRVGIGLFWGMVMGLEILVAVFKDFVDGHAICARQSDTTNSQATKKLLPDLRG